MLGFPKGNITLIWQSLVDMVTTSKEANGVGFEILGSNKVLA